MTTYFFIIILDIWYFPYNVLKRYSILLLWGRILSILYELTNKTISNEYSSFLKHLVFLIFLKIFLKILVFYLNPLPIVTFWFHVVLLSSHTISLSLKKQNPLNSQHLISFISLDLSHYLLLFLIHYQNAK